MSDLYQSNAILKLKNFPQPVQFCNLNHEYVYKRIFFVSVVLALIPISVDLFYEFGRGRRDMEGEEDDTTFY